MISAALLGRGGDVVEDQLVGALAVVLRGQLDRVAGDLAAENLTPRMTRPRLTSRQGMIRRVSISVGPHCQGRTRGVR